MSIPDQTGESRPLRVAGIALLAVAGLAFVVGMVGLLRGGDGSDTAAPPATSETTTAPGTPSPTGAPESTGVPAPTTSASPPVPSTPPAPGTTTPAPGAPGSPADGTVPVGETREQVRVYNNSTVRGLATRAADDFTADGWAVIEVGNYNGGTVPTTTVYYQPGTPQQRAAEFMSSEFGIRSEPRFAGIADASPGLIVIITNDYGTRSGNPGK